MYEDIALGLIGICEQVRCACNAESGPLVAMSKVLVVDDDPGIRNLARLTLSLDGHSVPTASGGREALEILTRESIDLMVLDLRMPVMDGAEVLQEARREGYDGPVLIVSAYGAKPAAEQLLADDAIDKPFDPRELSAHVHRLLELNARA